MKKIFLVDDDDLMRELIRRWLVGEGFDVVDFHSASSALPEILCAPPDLLITDLQMPGMTGFELVEGIRSRGAAVPVIVVTGNPSPEIVTRARDLGITHVLKKSPHEFAALWGAVQSTVSIGDGQATADDLDELRLEFLTDMSHQLRTPVTALKLAMEGLFSQLRSVMDPAQENLAQIGRRNVERIVALVENQLDLLQMMTGDTRVARRLVDFNHLVRAIPTRLLEDEEPGESLLVDLRWNGRPLSISDERPMLLYTDPEQLNAIVDCLVLTAPPKIRRHLTLDYDEATTCFRLDLALGLLPTDVGSDRVWESVELGGNGFEHRAYQSLVGQLGGTIELRKDINSKHARIVIPRYPEFDRRKDFVDPVRKLREHAERSGETVSFLRCEIGETPPADYLTAIAPAVRDLIARIQTATSEGDFVLRGRHAGTLYVALIGRSDNEIDHIREFLKGDPGAVSTATCFVSKPQTIIPEAGQADELLGTLELV